MTFCFIGNFIETEKYQRPLDRVAKTIVVKREQKIPIWKNILTVMLLCLVSISSYPLAFFIINLPP